MQRLLVALASLTLALAGYAGGFSPSVSAPRQIARVAWSTTGDTGPDQDYLDRLAAAGVPLDDPAGVVEDGHGVCVILDSHSSPGELVIAEMAMQKDHGLTEDQARTMVVTAVQVFCPNHQDAIA